MAGFCLECFRKSIDERPEEECLAVSGHLEQCESCGEYKQTFTIQSN